MWRLEPTDEYRRRHKRYEKNHPRELQAVLDNLDTYLETLKAGVNPLQIQHGFMHREPLEVVAIDQKGGGRGLAQTRLTSTRRSRPRPCTSSPSATRIDNDKGKT